MGPVKVPEEVLGQRRVAATRKWLPLSLASQTTMSWADIAILNRVGQIAFENPPAEPIPELPFICELGSETALVEGTGYAPSALSSARKKAEAADWLVWTRTRGGGCRILIIEPRWFAWLIKRRDFRNENDPALAGAYDRS